MRLVSEYRIADIVIVGNLNVIEQYDVLKFRGISDNAVVPDKRRTSYEGSGPYLCTVSDDARSADVVVRISLCILCDPHILLGMIVLIRRKCRTYLKDQFLDAFECFPGIRKSLEIVPCQRM